LEKLIEHGYGSKVLDFAVSKLSKNVDILAVKGCTCCAPEAVRMMQRVLQAVVPQLKDISLVPEYSSPVGFCRLLKVLTNNKLPALETLELAIPPATAYRGKVRNLLRALLSSQPNLRQVSLYPAIGSSVRDCSDIILQDIISSIESRQETTPVLESLKLADVKVSDISDLTTFLACPRMPSRVNIRHLTLNQQEWNSTTAFHSSVTNSSPIERLDLDQCLLASADSLYHMLCDFADFLPHLKACVSQTRAMGRKMLQRQQLTLPNLSWPLLPSNS